MDIREEFSKIQDVRHPSYIDHPLADVCIIITCAALCGIDSLEKISVYAKGKAQFFKEKFGIEKIPSASTLCRILRVLDPKEVSDAIVKIMKQHIEIVDEILAVDGKAIRSTSRPNEPHSALQVLTVFGTESGISFEQKQIHNKTNEIPVFQEILNYLNIKDKVITADAMHCQKETCRKIIEKGGNYVLGLKENQQVTYEEAKLFLNDKNNENLIETFVAPPEKGHGRIDQRICRKIKDISWIDGNWSGIKSIFSVRRISEKNQRKSEETRYYITSLDASPEKLLQISRDHWKIESMHWQLDVVFNEDNCPLQSDEAQLALNSFRKLALALHRNYLKNNKIKGSAPNNMLKCLIDNSLLLNVIKNL